jgi:O-antigen/teichoic acid export membrane protein
MSTTRTIIRNTAFMFAAQIALRVVNPIFGIFIVRQLGDAQFGEYSVLLTWVTIFSVLGDMGVAQYMSREISRDREKALHLFWDVAALRFILGLIASTVTVGGAILLGYDSTFIAATIIYCLGYFLQAIIVPLGSIIAGYERLDVISVLGVAGQLIYIAAGIIALLLGDSYIWLVVATLVNMPILIVALVWLVRRYRMTPPPFKLHPATWWGLVRAGFPFGITQVSLTLAYRFDTLLLNNFVVAQVIGWYNAAYNFSRALTTFAAAFSASLVPTLAREHATNPEVVRKWYYRSFRLLLFMGLPLAVGGTLLAHKIMPFLYGEDFQAASIAFAILIWDTLLLMYTSLGGNIAQAIGKEVAAARIFGFEAVVNLILNLIFIPQYGMIAAAVVTVATELSGALLFYLVFRREFGAGLDLRHSLRLAFCAAIMGIVIYLLQDESLLVSIPVGAAVYGVATLLTNALTPEERMLVGGLIQRVTRKMGNLVSAKA